MPYITDPSTQPDYQGVALADGAATQDSRSFATQYTMAQQRSPFSSAGGVAGLAVAGVADLADTVASSLIPGVKRQDLNNTFLNAIGSPGLTAWHAANQGAVETAGTIAGVIGAQLIANKITAPAGVVMNTLREIPWVGKVAGLDAQYANAQRLAQITMRETSLRGISGVEKFLGPELNLARLGAPALSVSAGTANRAVISSGIAKGVFNNAVLEGVMAAGLHTNSQLYSDDIAHNIAWGAAMAGGLALVDSAVGVYALRKMANSSMMRRLNAASYDVNGLENARVMSSGVALELQKVSPGLSKDSSFLFGGAGGTTDKITSLAIDAAELQLQRGTSERQVALFQNREAIANPKLQMAQEELQKVTGRGLYGLSDTGFGGDMEGLVGPMRESLARDPAVHFGLESVGTNLPGLTRAETVAKVRSIQDSQFQQGRKLLTDGGTWTKRKVKGPDGSMIDQSTLVPLSDDAKEQLIQQQKELQFVSSHVPVTMLEPGEWAPIAHGELAEGFQPRLTVKEGGLGADDLAIWSRGKQDASEPTLGISSTGDIFTPGGAHINRLSNQDMLGLYHVGNAAVRDMAKTGSVFTLPKNPNWFQLDMAEQLLKATDNPGAVAFPGTMTRQTAQVESLAQKVDALSQRRQAMTMAAQRGLTEPLSESQVYANKVYFNLPRQTSYEQGLMSTSETPLDFLMQGFNSGADVRASSFDNLVKGLNDSKQIKGFTDDTVSTLGDLHGNSFNFLMDRDGKAIAPIIGFKRPLAPFQWTRDELTTRMITKQYMLHDTLMGDTADPWTRRLTQVITADPNFTEAAKVMDLADDQQRSMVPGFRNSAPQTAMGAAMNAVTYSERRDVDSLPMLAASKIRELQTRLTAGIMRETIQAAMGDTVTQIMGTRNIASKLLTDQFYSYRQGWELLKDTVPQSISKDKDGIGFVLDHDSITNQKRFAQMFGGQELQKGQLLLSPQGKPVVLDELGQQLLNGAQQIHETKIAMQNTLLRANGQPELNPVPFYAPPPNLKGRYVAYTFDQQNRVVPGMMVNAGSPEELAKMKAELTKSPQWQSGYRVRQRDDIGDFMNIWDKAQMDFVAPNTTAILPGKSNFGNSQSNLLNTNATQEALKSMQDGLVAHGDELMSVLYADPLKSAQARSKNAQVESQVGNQVDRQHSSIFDRYTQNLLGRNALGAKDSFFGDILGPIEKKLNGLANGAPVDRAAEIFGVLHDWIANGVGLQSGSSKAFKMLTEQLGPHMPFATVNEMLARETGSKTPREIANLTSKLSWFEATSRLRWFESMHAVANFGGILANTPSVIKALQPMVGESLEQAAARNSSLTMMMKTPAGQAFNMPNIPKLMWQGMKDAWQKTPDEFTQLAMQQGTLHQEVAEFNRAWGSIDSKEGWHGFVFGNAAHDTSADAGIFSKAAGKVTQSGGLDHWMGIMSDRSEEFSRAWGMYMGRIVARDTLGMTDVAAQHAFAHELTNKMIANYDPRNRPELFQGALGAPIGLFQSYVMNFYQRMTRYLETGNSKALASQYLMQGAVFGMQSVPGWGALNWAFFDHGQGAGKDMDPVESIYHRFDNATADLIMHGTLSNLPKLFGADGVSLYTRGDAQIRMPVLNAPVYDTASRIMKGLKQGWDMFNQGKVNGTQMAEIASNMITNRPLSGLIEDFGAHGADTDWNGKVVTQSKNTADYVYRALGLRSMQQDKNVEDFYANRNVQTQQAAMKQAVNLSARAEVRDGNMDALPGLFAKYVQDGGDPRYYTRWLNNTVASATTTRSQQMLTRALKDPNNNQNAVIGRLLDSQIDISQEAQQKDDYGRQALIDQGIQSQYAASPEPTGNPLDHSTITLPTQ